MFRGADKNIKNKSNEDAYQVAIAAGHHVLADTIQKFRTDQIGSLIGTEVHLYSVTLSDFVISNTTSPSSQTLSSLLVACSLFL